MPEKMELFQDFLLKHMLHHLKFVHDNWDEMYDGDGYKDFEDLKMKNALKKRK